MIESLQKLRNIEPSDETLRAIKMRIDTRVSKMPSPQRNGITSPYIPKLSKRDFFFLVPAMALSFALIFIAVNGTNASLTRARLAISHAKNAHTASVIAVDTVRGTSKNITLAINDTNTLASIEKSIDLANTTLDGLQLMGETGKYTMAECLSDYHKYYELLESIEDSIDKGPYPQTVAAVAARDALLKKIIESKEHAEDRIGKYPEAKAQEQEIEIISH